MLNDNVKSIISFVYSNLSFYKKFYDQDEVKIESLITYQDMINIHILTKDML